MGYLVALIIIIRLVVYLSRPNGGYDPAPSPPPRPVYREPEINPNYLFSNAPKHWGRISDKFLRDNEATAKDFDKDSSEYVLGKRQFMLNSLILLGNIRENLETNYGVKVHSSYADALLDFKYQNGTSCCIEKLFDKGVISIAGIVIDKHERYGVVLLDAPTPLSYIEELRTYFIADGYKELIYYALHDPSTVTHPRKLKFENFNKFCFKFDQNKQGIEHRKYAEYALWWKGNSDKGFLASSVKKNTEIYLDLIDHHNSYALGILSFAFGLKDDNSRTAMPDKDYVTIEGPEGVQIIISLSATNGINFHFPLMPDHERYRDNFIAVFLNFCYDVRAQVLEHDMPEDDLGHPSSLIWFNDLVSRVENTDDEVEAVGILTKGNNYRAN